MMTPACPADQLTNATAPRPGAPARDVVVLGSAGVGYLLTDALRDTGLSVGSWLLPAAASPDRARLQLRHTLDGGGQQAATVASWRRAPLLIDCFTDPIVADEIEPAVHARLHGRGTGVLRLHLSPGAGHRPPGALGVCAPLELDLEWERLYCPPITRLTLSAEAAGPLAAAISPYARTLRTLLGILPPPPPGHRSRWSTAADQFDGEL